MFFPLMIDLTKAKVLIIGGGKIALRKTEKILSYEGIVDVISIDFEEDFEKLKKIYKDKIYLHREKIDDNFRFDRIENYDLVYVATNNSTINQKISEFCIKNRILVNSVDDHKKSSFINMGFFESKIDEDDVVVAVSCKGKNPRKVKNILESLKKLDKNQEK